MSDASTESTVSDSLSSEQIDSILAAFDSARHNLSIFMSNVADTIGKHPNLTSEERPVVHSFKSRLKDRDHLCGKIRRKVSAGRQVNRGNFLQELTDLAGVRTLHLFQEDFGEIDGVIRERVHEGDWFLAETPKAYTWDPEAATFFRRFDLEVNEKPSSYTSVHYLVRPRAESPLCCEVQVRTLFEEIWGEVDHQINYQVPTGNLACKEQIMVLSKIVGAGRLLDSLRRVYDLDRQRD